MVEAPDLDAAARPSGRAKSILIEGWRGINHSFALVNQYQILQWLSFGNLRVFHRDLPFAFSHWDRRRNGSGLSAEDQARVDSLGAPEGEDVDCVYRICAPFVAGAEDDRRRTVTFMVTELGLSDKNFNDSVTDPGFFTRGDNIIAAPSHWARRRVVERGFPEEKVKVVPHGVDALAFPPVSADERVRNRATLGLAEDETVFFNVGLPTWNKGVDLVLVAFARLRSAGRKVRLILKDQEDVYGLSVKGMIQELGRTHPELVRADTLGAISVVSNNLSRTELRLLYGVADCYVSPYRAEGFNLPVLEAIACGTPVIVTRGGATDDFCTDEVAIRIGGAEGRRDDPSVGFRGMYIEPHLSELLGAMDGVVKAGRGAWPSFETARRDVTERFTWRNAAIELARLAVDYDTHAIPLAAPIRITTPPRPVSQADILDLVGTIRPMAMAKTPKIRVGNHYDGGYVLPETALLCDAVLSIGVGPDVSFDMAFAERGAKIAQFDHTVEKPPTSHDNFVFYKLGWGPETKGDLLSFEDILTRFAALSPTRALLKFDIEGFEYPVLDALDADHLRAFDVIVCEFHDFNRLTEPPFFERVKRGFEKLTRFHVPVHLHANNYADLSLVLGVPIPNVVEVSFLRRDLDDFPGRSLDPIPGPLDRPNHPYRVDICMNPF